MAVRTLPKTHPIWRGFTLLSLQSLGIKATNLAAQLLLARWLMPRDYGLVALACTLAAFGSLIPQLGIEAFLVQRGVRRFELWAPSAAGFCFWGGLLVSLALLGVSPILQHLYHEAVLPKLLACLALRLWLDTWCIVPTAALTLREAFGTLAGIGLLVNTLTTGATLVLAWQGYGFWSFIFPLPAVGLLRWGFLAHQAGTGLGLRGLGVGSVDARSWRLLWRQTRWMLLGTLAWTWTSQGDYAILGLFTAPAQVGLYFLAFNLSIQSVQLLTGSLTSALMPLLSPLDKTARRAHFLAVTAKLCAWGLPLCCLQALLARPGMRLVFASRWEGSIVFVEILSLAMGFQMVLVPAQTLLKAQRAWGTLARINLLLAVGFTLLIAPLAWWSGALGVSWGVGLFLFLATWITLRAAAPGVGLLALVARPLALSLPAALIPNLIFFFSPQPPLLELLGSLLGFALIYAVGRKSPISSRLRVFVFKND